MSAIFSWPGIEGVIDFTYTASIGITPGVAVMTAVPNTDTQFDSGTLIFSDGLTTYTLTDCRVAAFQAVMTSQGRVWRLTIQDRRWRWEFGYPVNGHFNQTDRHDKLIPWTVRSPYQLAAYLLEAMGETNYFIDLPGGLANPNADGFGPPGPNDIAIDPATDYLSLGQNVPQVGTNNPVSWVAMPAARALANLAEQYGRVVVWDPATDQVSIQVMGDGDELPDGAVLTYSPSLDPKAVPSKLTVVGAPTRFQVRLAFRAVGLDWDDTWQTLDELTYAPQVNGQADWTLSFPPTFATVTPTDRLNYRQARALAESTVYRCYQLLAVDPANRQNRGIPIPGLDGEATIDNRYRLVLQDTRPEPITPRPGDVTRVDPETGQPFAAEVYNGYSKDRLPATFGSVHTSVVSAGAVWVALNDLDADGNTPATAQLYIPFQITDPERQVIAYESPLWRLTKTNQQVPEVHPPDIVVETGVLVLDAVTLMPHRYSFTVEIPGGEGPERVVVQDDVQLEVIGEYDINHNLTGWHQLDADAANRARYYAEAIAANYQPTGALTNTYAGIMVIHLSGVVRQVSFEMSADGFVTRASANCEHSSAVIPYPKRRRQENLPANGLQAMENFLSGPAARESARNAMTAAGEAK